MKFYQRIAEYYNKIFPLNPKQIEFVENESDGKSVLEVGCATGELTIALGETHDKVVGIDLDAELLKRAKAKLPQVHVQFRQMNMLNLQDHFEENSFDTVVCFGNTLAHLSSEEEILNFFEQVRKILKPEGRFLLQIINFDRIIDQSASDLPLISNECIEFHRKYVYHKTTNRIVFRSQLYLINKGEIISNQIPLFPLRRSSLSFLLQESGFKYGAFYGSFQRTPFAVDCSIPLIVSAC